MSIIIIDFLSGTVLRLTTITHTGEEKIHTPDVKTNFLQEQLTVG